MDRKVRLLILRGGAIGDFVLTLPAIQALRDQWPESYIELIGYPHIANLALAAGLVDHVDSLDGADMARFFALQPAFTEEQAGHIKSFDLIISYLHDPAGIVRSNLLAAGARQVIYGSPIVTEGHAVDHLIKPLETLAIYGAGRHPVLKLREDLVQRGRNWLAGAGISKKAFAVHPGSGSPKKNWPIGKFAELTLRLAKAGTHAPFLIIGEADGHLSSEAARLLPDVPVLAGRTLVEVASVLAASDGYVGNDSGITHLAAAVGLPVVSVFGSSRLENWGPRGTRVRILQAPDGNLDKLSVEEVLAAIL